MASGSPSRRQHLPYPRAYAPQAYVQPSSFRPTSSSLPVFRRRARSPSIRRRYAVPVLPSPVVVAVETVARRRLVHPGRQVRDRRSGPPSGAGGVGVPPSWSSPTRRARSRRSSLVTVFSASGIQLHNVKVASSSDSHFPSEKERGRWKSSPQRPRRQSSSEMIVKLLVPYYVPRSASLKTISEKSLFNLA